MKSVLVKTSLVATLLASVTACCSGNHAAEYAGKGPEITVKSFYTGPVEGYGFFQDRSGKITSRYYATLVPSWNGNEGTLVEKQWNDKGELFFQQNWQIHLAEDGHHFSATATRIDGKVKGESAGYALHMRYTVIASTEKGDDIKLHADDWTYLQPDGHGINKVGLSKYGFHVGDITYDLHPLAKGHKLHEGYWLPEKK
jgi:hypothetical protein